MVETGNPYRDNVSRLITWGHWFSFFNIILAMLIATRYLGAISWPSTTLGVIYLVVSWIGHFSFLSFVTYLLTIFPLSFVLPKEKSLRFISAIIATLALVLLLIDTQVFRLFKFHLNSQVWQLLLDQAQTEEGSIWSIIFVAVPTIFLLQLLLSAYVWRKINKRKRRQYGNQVGLALLICFILTHVVNSWADATLYQPITMQRANFPLSYPMTARSFLAKHGWLDLDQYEKQAASQGDNSDSRMHYPLRPLNVNAPLTHNNLLIVVVDSLRFDMLNNINMPNLQRYADQHLTFPQSPEWRQRRPDGHVQPLLRVARSLLQGHQQRQASAGAVRRDAAPGLPVRAVRRDGRCPEVSQEHPRRSAQTGVCLRTE